MLQHIGRYRILREIGRETLAAVYLARDPESGQQVAVKVLVENFTAAPDFEPRFLAEMQAVKALEHPYLAPVLDYGREGEQYFIVTRYLPGGSLAGRLEGQPLLLAEVVPIAQRLAEALDAAHTAGLVHGNINPGNVLYDLHERSFLADLGLNHLLAPSAGPELSGSPNYMSPEQVEGVPFDGRADVYALGVLLFQMLTGELPFAAESAFQLLRQHVEQPVPQLSEAALARLVLPPEFNQVLARALAKNPDARYPTAGVLAEAVRSRFVMQAGAPAASALPGTAVAAAALRPPGAANVPPAAGGLPTEAPPAAAAALPAAALPPAMPPVVGELVREGEPPAARGLALPVILALGGGALVLLLLVLLSRSFIVGLFNSSTETPTPAATSTASQPPIRTSTAPAVTLSPAIAVTASLTATVTKTTRATASQTTTRLPTATPRPTQSATASSTRLPAFTATVTALPPTDTAETPTATSTATLQPQPPPASNISPAPTATPSRTATITLTPSDTPTASPTAAPLFTPQ